MITFHYITSHERNPKERMKEVIVHPSPDIWTEIVEVPIPKPGKDDVLIKVIAAGSNVKDWDHLTRLNISLNSGDDIAGVVHELGENVTDLKVGERVAAFHPMMTPGGAYAEYAIAPSHTVFRIPDDMQFEEAATFPLILTTAALTLYRRQNLPPPWSPRSDSSSPLPLIIYGASSALGTFAIKLALASNIHPIIAIAGSSNTHILPLLDPSKGDAVVDYRLPQEEMINAVKEKLHGLESFHALDAISSQQLKTWVPLSQMLAPSREGETSYLSVVSGANKYDEQELNSGVKIVYTYVGTAHSGAYKSGMPKQAAEEDVKGDPEWVGSFWKHVEGMLKDGRLRGHPFEVVEGGLAGVGNGLKWLKEGRARGVKFVYRIGEV